MCQLLADNRKISHFKRELVMLRHYCSLFFIKWIVVYHGGAMVKRCSKGGKNSCQFQPADFHQIFQKMSNPQKISILDTFFCPVYLSLIFSFLIFNGFGLAEERILLRTVIFSKKRVQTDDIFKIGQISDSITKKLLFFYLFIYTFHVSLSFFHSLIRKSRSRSLASSPCFVGR